MTMMMIMIMMMMTMMMMTMMMIMLMMMMIVAPLTQPLIATTTPTMHNLMQTQSLTSGGVRVKEAHPWVNGHEFTPVCKSGTFHKLMSSEQWLVH